MAQLPGKLQHVGAKIARSIEHLQALDIEITAFLDSKPCEISSKFDAEQRSHSYRAKPIKDIPLRIRVLTGEVLGQLRSALDHLAWQLALLETSRPKDSTEFPIFKDCARYRSERARKIGSLPADAKRIIDEVQPHGDKAPEKNFLWKLHRLANSDKHRLPHVAFAAPQGLWLGEPPTERPRGGRGIGWSVGARRGRDIGLHMRMGPFETEEEIGRITFKDPSETDFEVDNLHIVLDLAFATTSAAKGEAIRDELRTYGEGVEEIIKKFVRFF